MKRIKRTIGEASRFFAVKRGKKLLVCDLKREHNIIRKEIEGAVKRVLDSGWYILGRELEAFEDEFASYVGSSNAIGVASGTEALQLALMALSVGRGDEVITAVNTAIPTAMAIVSTGARPKFVDVDEDTSNIDIDGFDKAITKRTKAIIPVHLYGSPCNMSEVIRISKKHHIAVVEDCAQAHGAEHANKKVGTFGDIGAFSFYPTKNLGCYGDGGAVVTDNKKLAAKVKLLRNYGQPTRYVCDIEGINSRLDEIQAAILRVKLRRLDHSISRRIEIASQYGKYLKNIFEVKFPPLRLCRNDRNVVIARAEGPKQSPCGEASHSLSPSKIASSDAKHSFHLYVIRCKRRDALKDFLAMNRIETQIHYPIPLHLQKAFKGLGYKKGDFPVAEKLAGEILSLPIFPALKNSEIGTICSSIKDFYKKR